MLILWTSCKNFYEFRKTKLIFYDGLGMLIEQAAESFHMEGISQMLESDYTKSYWQLLIDTSTLNFHLH